MKDYNFFEEYQSKKGIDINPGSPYFIGAMVLVLCTMLCVGLIARNIVLTNQISTTNAEIMAIKETPKYQEAEKLQISIAAMANYDQTAEQVLKTFLGSSIISTEAMSTLSASLPSTVTITSLTMDNASATFSFSVPNRKAVAELLLGMKDSLLFQHVELISITTDQDGKSAASVAAVMKAGEVQ